MAISILNGSAIVNLQLEDDWTKYGMPNRTA